MWENYFAAALRHLGRNKIYVAIGVLGLAIGLWAALLAALEIQAEYSHDHFITGYEQVYRVLNTLAQPGRPVSYNDSTHNRVAAQAVLQFPQISGATRIAGQSLTVQRGAVRFKEHVGWADANFFEVLPMPVVAGELATSLHRPDGVVLTRSMARKYFGRDDPIGQSITLSDARQQMGQMSSLGGPRTMVVTSVIEDLPESENQFETSVFASGVASYSLLTSMDNDPLNAPHSMWYGASVATFLRLTPGASIDAVRSGLPELLRRVHDPLQGPLQFSLELIRIDRLNAHSGLFPEFSTKLTMVIVLGTVTLIIGGVNFVNLLTARLGQRGREVGVRKVTGASRGILILQFLTESIIYALAAMMIAAALTEWTLPAVNAFLDSGAHFEYWRDPVMLASLLGTALLVGAFAGAYPALMLSGFRPLTVLKGLSAHSRGATFVRNALVTVQFAILVGLMICAAVIYQQRTFATREALRVSADQVLMIRSPCTQPLVASLDRLAGVRAAACTGQQFVWKASTGSFPDKNKNPVTVNIVPTDPGIFGLFGVTPVAGRLPLIADAAAPAGERQYVVNESAARMLGFASPQAAVGQTLAVPSMGPRGDRPQTKWLQIVGVVPDFSFYPVTQKIEPTVYLPEPGQFNLIAVKLTGRQIPETLEAIDQAWAKTGGDGPVNRFFLNDHIQSLYQSVLRQSQAFGVLCGVAIVLACVGLLGMSAATAERRTREVGIRKAMGAATADIFTLMLWTFARPVLWSSLIAWAVAGYAMTRWLQRFAYHVDLHFWVFLAAAAASLTIALLTVSVHLVTVARARPVTALRYE